MEKRGKEKCATLPPDRSNFRQTAMRASCMSPDRENRSIPPSAASVARNYLPICVCLKRADPVPIYASFFSSLNLMSVSAAAAAVVAHMMSVCMQSFFLFSTIGTLWDSWGWFPTQNFRASQLTCTRERKWEWESSSSIFCLGSWNENDEQEENEKEKPKFCTWAKAWEGKKMTRPFFFYFSG